MTFCENLDFPLRNEGKASDVLSLPLTFLQVDIPSWEVMNTVQAQEHTLKMTPLPQLSFPFVDSGCVQIDGDTLLLMQFCKLSQSQNFLSPNTFYVLVSRLF